MSDMINNIIKSRSVYFAWLTAALFFFYQYVLRVSPGVMHHELRTEFLLTAQQFASFGSIYLLVYSILQIPLGVLMDKYGAKIVILVSILLCSIGSIMFYYANTLSTIQFARFLIGAGSAAAFMSALKIVADNMPPGNRAVLLGLTLTIGVMGALFSGTIISSILTVISWREIYKYMAFFGFLMFVFACFSIKKSITQGPIVRANMSSFSISSMLLEISIVLKNPVIVMYAILSVGLYTPLSVLADLMGVAFIEQKLLVNNVISARTTMQLYLGLAVGSIMIPYLCERYNIINRGIQVCATGILISFCILLYFPDLSLEGVSFILFIIGVLCGSEMLCFTGALRVSDHQNSGVIIGTINTLNMLGCAILDQFTGYLLDLQWNHMYDINNVRVYSVQNFVITFSSLVVVIFIAVIISMFLRRHGR